MTNTDTDRLTYLLSTIADDEVMHAVNTLLAEGAIRWRPDPFLPNVYAMVSTNPRVDQDQAIIVLYLTDGIDFEVDEETLHNIMHRS